MGDQVNLLLRVPADALFDLEQRLYEPRFMGVPIGATLTDFFVTSRYDVGPTSTLRSLLLWWYFVKFGPRHRSALPPLASGRILLTWHADTTRLNDMLLPVLAELDPERCNVIGGAPSLRRKVSPASGFCTEVQILPTDRKSWGIEYARCRVAWHCQIRRWLREHHLPIRLFPYFASALAVRSLFVVGCINLLKRIEPAAILTDAEHNSPSCCLILAARQHGIPTVAMMHGVIYPPYGYTPLLSDVVLCWGEQQREQMIALGTEPERLLVTGCQRLSRVNRADRMEVRARLGLPLDNRVIMLASAPMLREEWHKLVFTFGDALEALPGVTGVVRLHASEKLENYRTEIARYPGIRFLGNHQWTVDEAMAACDVVVAHNSGLGNDALVMGRPVVLLDVLASPLSNGKALADKAGCPIARSASELRLVVNRILEDRIYREVLKNRAEEYVTWFCAAFGRDAAHNVTVELTKRLKIKPSISR